MSECPKHFYCLPESCGDCPNDAKCVTHHACDCIQRELDGYRNGNRDLHEECQRLRRELELEKSKRYLAVQMRELDAKELEAQRDELQGELESERYMVNAWRSEVEGARHDQAVAVAERDELRAMLDSYERVDGKLEASIVRLHRERDRFEAQADEIHAAYKQLEAERDRYRAVVERAEAWCSAGAFTMETRGVAEARLRDAIDDLRALNGGTDA